MTKVWNAKTMGLLVVAALFACIVAVPQAFAENVQLNAPTQVSDDITRLQVNKLDADTHEYVIGATMEIVNEETGEVVDSWVTDSSSHMNEKGLDVGVVYILREIEAPEGFDKVAEVRFVINETEGTGITILSQGSDSELTESYKVNLYDKRKPVERETVVTKTTTTPAPKTGDETPIPVVAGLVGAGLLIILVLQIVKRQLGRDEE